MQSEARDGRSRSWLRSDGTTTPPSGRLILLFAAVFAIVAALADRAAGDELTAAAFGMDPDRTARVSTRVEADPELVWQVLSDLEGWPRVFPEIERVSVRRDAHGRRIIEQQSEALGLQITTTAFVSADAEHRMLMLSLVPNGSRKIRSMTSVWKLTADGQGTRIELVSQVESGHPVPAFIARRAVSASLQRAVGGLVAEVERRRPVEVAASF